MSNNPTSNGTGNGNAFDFIERPQRTLKPRGRSGLSVLSDYALSLDQARAMVETRADIIDHIKMPDHVGLMWRMDAAWFVAKNKIYRDAGIDTLPGGVPFEVAMVQGKVAQFFARVAELGFSAVEVSEDSIDIPAVDREAAIRLGAAQGLQVFTEIGKKLPAEPLDPVKLADMAKRDLDCGAHLVVVEKSDVALVMHAGGDQIHRLVELVGLDNMVIECGPGDDRFKVASWLMNNFGPDVNIENIDVGEGWIIEAMRHGLHRGAEYRYFHPFEGASFPPVA